MPLTLSTVSPTAVPRDGGYLIELTGTFARQNPHDVYIGTAEFKALQPGKAGQLFPLTTTRLQAYTPRFSAGGPFEVYVQDLVTLETAVLSGALTFLESPYFSSVFDIRQVMPPRMLVGARQVDQLPRIGG